MKNQQGSAPSYYGIAVQQYLVRKLPNRWKSRARPIPWPPSLTDLTPCDYYL